MPASSVFGFRGTSEGCPYRKPRPVDCARDWVPILRWVQAGFGLEQTNPLFQAPPPVEGVLLVPEGGVEPPSPEGQRILSPPRLPFRHSGARGGTSVENPRSVGRPCQTGGEEVPSPPVLGNSKGTKGEQGPRIAWQPWERRRGAVCDILSQMLHNYTETAPKLD